MTLTTILSHASRSLNRFFFFLGRLGKKEKKFDNLKVMLSRENSRLFFSLSYFDRNDTCLCNLNVVVLNVD